MSITYRGMELPGLSREISITLYRVLQEAVTNVMKHAGAKRMRVTLACRQEVISLSVKDDGQGLARGSSGRGIGLAVIKERLEPLGGRLELRSRPGAGTRMTATIPWRKEGTG